MGVICVSGPVSEMSQFFSPRVSCYQHGLTDGGRGADHEAVSCPGCPECVWGQE